MPRRWLLTMVALVGVTLIALRPELRPSESAETKPQLFTLTEGSARRVADGRARLWLDTVDRAHTVSGGAVVTAARVDLDCLGRTYTVWATAQPGEEICGCRVRLVEAIDTTPPSATIEVISTPNYRPVVQAATQVGADGRGSAGARR